MADLVAAGCPAVPVVTGLVAGVTVALGLCSGAFRTSLLRFAPGMFSALADADGATPGAGGADTLALGAVSRATSP